VLPIDVFAGGVPAAVIYMDDSKELRELVSKSTTGEGRLNTIAEVSFIGLIAYFEAFCKNHFASLLNICPALIWRLKEAGQNVNIEATSLLNFRENLQHRLGFLVSEQYDFGTARKINTFYHTILKVNPFSKDEGKRYDRILNDRNLLTHNGGIFTTRYSEQIFAQKSIGEIAHWRSLIIGKRQFLSVAEFLEKIVRKTAAATQRALIDFVKSESIELAKSEKEALEVLLFDHSR
jgi:hypothetical protein